MSLSSIASSRTAHSDMRSSACFSRRERSASMVRWFRAQRVVVVALDRAARAFRVRCVEAEQEVRRRAEVARYRANCARTGSSGRTALGLEVLAYSGPRYAYGVGQLLYVHRLALRVVPVHKVGQTLAEDVVHRLLARLRHKCVRRFQYSFAPLLGLLRRLRRFGLARRLRGPWPCVAWPSIFSSPIMITPVVTLVTNMIARIGPCVNV